jgi:hypothetical protein
MDYLPPRKLRTIRQEPCFDEQVRILALDHARLDEVLGGVFFVLARSPERYPCIERTNLRAFCTRVYPSAPSLRIFYTFDEDTVSLHFIEFAPSEPDSPA